MNTDEMPSKNSILTESKFYGYKIKRETIKIGKAEVEAYYGRAHKYKPTSLALIARLARKEAWVLDVGGGDRILKLPNFVNLDISRASRFVTVVGDAHHLPFRDEAFDLIICEAVIEHLRKPWIAVEELHRVLKPSGYVYVEVAFMQPVHSHPSHYFNMTREGVRVLFEKFEEISSGVHEYQMPSYTLTFILSRYIRCLLPWLDKYAKDIEFYDHGTFISGRAKPASFSIAFLYRLLNKMLKCFDRFIKPEKALEIAAGTYLIGRKKGK